MTPRASIAALLLTAVACTDSSGSGRGAPPPTAILVEPGRFLGDVPCLDAPGAMRRYVATLFDVSPSPRGDALPVSEVPLPSSAPVPCHLGVRFTLITPERAYVAEIDGYDVEDLTPLAAGSRVMIDADGNVIPPRWTTACGRRDDGQPGDVDGGSPDAAAPSPEVIVDGGSDAGDASVRPSLDGPVISIRNRTIPIRGCKPLTDLDPTRATTSLVVDIRPALGSLTCGTDVDAFTAVVRQTGQRLAGSCEAPLVLDEVTAGESYTIEVDAEVTLSDGGTARAVTTCFQIAREGVQARATCDPLRLSD